MKKFILLIIFIYVSMTPDSYAGDVKLLHGDRVTSNLVLTNATLDLSENSQISNQTAGITNSSSPDTMSALLHELADEMVRNFLEWQPHLVTLLGLPLPLHHKIEDRTLKALQSRQEQMVLWQKRLNKLDPEALNSHQDRVLLGLIEYRLESDLAARICRRELWNVTHLGGWQVQYPRLAGEQPVGDANARQWALARFGQLPDYIDTEIVNLRTGMELGYLVPRVVLERVINQVENLLELSPAESPFMALANRAREGDGDEKELNRFAQEVEALIANEINPAFGRYRDFLVKEYIPRETAGVNIIPDGDACYTALIRGFTTLELSPREIHETGLHEMVGIHKEMLEIGGRLFDLHSVPEILEHFRTNPGLLYTERDEILEVAQNAVERARDAMPDWFGILPKADVVIEPFPAFMEANAPLASYRLPAEDGSRPGTYMINLYEPHRQPRGLTEAIAFHEAIPGHHLQIAIQQELKGVHMLARYLSAPSYIEGWALYTERLAHEMGLYSGDLDRLGMLSLQAFRAARLVVDTGIHALEWDREQAVDYMLANTAETRETINVEVDRYIITPGQATAYMVGMLEIIQLRELAEERLGDSFDIRTFHDRILEDGGVTLPFLREKIETWVSEIK